METNFEYLIQILRDPSLDTWTLEEQQEINNRFIPGLTYFLI
jgi:hypothetical protein